MNGLFTVQNFKRICFNESECNAETAHTAAAVAPSVENGHFETALKPFQSRTDCILVPDKMTF